MDGMFPAVLKTLTSPSGKAQQLAMLVLRNFCFLREWHSIRLAL